MPVSTPSRDVLVFWDYENCRPPSNSTGQDVADAIRHLAHQFGGTIKTFRAYVGISDSASMMTGKSATLHSQLQLSGVSMIDCPHIGSKDVADIMMIVDIMTAAMDSVAEETTFVVITEDKDFTYALSTLRLRNYQVVLIHKDQAHPILRSRASQCHDWNAVVNQNKAPTNDTCNPPGTSIGDAAEPTSSKPRSRSRRASRASSFSCPAPTSSKPLPDAAVATEYLPATPASSYMTEWESCKSSFKSSSSSVHHHSSSGERPPVYNLKSAPQIPTTTGATDAFGARLMGGAPPIAHHASISPPPANTHALLGHHPSSSVPTMSLPNGTVNFTRSITSNGIPQSQLEGIDSGSFIGTPETIQVHRPASCVGTGTTVPSTSEIPTPPRDSSEHAPIASPRPPSPGSVNPRSTPSIPLVPQSPSTQSHTRQDLDVPQAPVAVIGAESGVLPVAATSPLTAVSTPPPKAPTLPTTPSISCPQVERVSSIISIADTELGDDMDEDHGAPTHPMGMDDRNDLPGHLVASTDPPHLSRSSTVVPDTQDLPRNHDLPGNRDLPVYDWDSLPSPSKIGREDPASERRIEQIFDGRRAMEPLTPWTPTPPAPIRETFSPEVFQQTVVASAFDTPSASRLCNRPNDASPGVSFSFQPYLQPKKIVQPNPSLSLFDFSRAIDAPSFQPGSPWHSPTSVQPSTSAHAAQTDASMYHVPPPAMSQLVDEPPPAPLKEIPPGMTILIQVLEEWSASCQPKAPKASVLSTILALEPDLFAHAGVLSSSAYFSKSETLRVAKMGSGGSSPAVPWISLNEVWKTLYRDPRPLGVGKFAPTSPVIGHSVSSPLSASPTGLTSSTKSALPAHFVSLVTVLENTRSTGSKLPEGAVLRSALSHQLLQSDKQIYATSGFGTFTAFAEAAEKAGIVQLGSVPGKPGSEWIRVVDWRERYSLPLSGSSSSGPSYLASPTPIPFQPVPKFTPVPVPTPKPVSKTPPPKPKQVVKAASPAPKLVVQAEFQPLVRVLRELSSKGNNRHTRIKLGMELSEATYKKAGVKNFKPYIALAEKANVIDIGGAGPNAWVSLRTEWA